MHTTENFPRSMGNTYFNRGSIIKAILLISVFIVIINLGALWIRPAHIISGFIWWGMVFFINFLILPIFPKLTQTTQFELLGKLFPRIFQFATVFGFFTISFGWFYALEFFAHWQISYFFANSINFVFLIAISLITLLYGFHLFLERKEIDLISKIANSEITYEDKEVQNLVSQLLVIPRVGFALQTLAVLIMFIH